MFTSNFLLAFLLTYLLFGGSGGLAAGMDLVCMREGNKAVFCSSVMSKGVGTLIS